MWTPRSAHRSPPAPNPAGSTARDGALATAGSHTQRSRRRATPAVPGATRRPARQASTSSRRGEPSGWAPARGRRSACGATRGRKRARAPGPVTSGGNRSGPGGAVRVHVGAGVRLVPYGRGDAWRRRPSEVLRAAGRRSRCAGELSDARLSACRCRPRFSDLSHRRRAGCRGPDRVRTEAGRGRDRAREARVSRRGAGGWACSLSVSPKLSRPSCLAQAVSLKLSRLRWPVVGLVGRPARRRRRRVTSELGDLGAGESQSGESGRGRGRRFGGRRRGWRGRCRAGGDRPAGHGRR